MKKAELSMSVIIGAAIALLILVIISVLLMNAFGNLQGGVSCTGVADDSFCIPSSESCSEYNAGGTQYTQTQSSCPTEDEKCCIPVGS